MNKETLSAFLKEEFPQASIEIEELGHQCAVVRKKIDHRHLRPGGTVSGPVLMETADVALYIAILNDIGLVSLAVTTNLNINFLRKPTAEKDIIAKCRLIKVGKTLAIGEVSLYSEDSSDVVAHAVGTYSLPPTR